jgi:hypothetical protein
MKQEIEAAELKLRQQTEDSAQLRLQFIEREQKMAEEHKAEVEGLNAKLEDAYREVMESSRI